MIKVEFKRTSDSEWEVYKTYNTESEASNDSSWLLINGYFYNSNNEKQSIFDTRIT